MKLQERAERLKVDIPAVFLALKRKETPWLAKALAFLAIAYALSPIDLIPDFIPVIGYLDDLLILPGLVALTIRMIPTPVMMECRRDAQALWQYGKPKKWYYALPIVAVWALLLFIVARAIWG